MQARTIAGGVFVGAWLFALTLVLLIVLVVNLFDIPAEIPTEVNGPETTTTSTTGVAPLNPPVPGG